MQQLLRAKTEVGVSLTIVFVNCGVYFIPQSFTQDSLSEVVVSQALDKSTLECLRLKERSMGLAKELASIKL